MNKPSGFITTTSDERDRRTVMESFPENLGSSPLAGWTATRRGYCSSRMTATSRIGSCIRGTG